MCCTSDQDSRSGQRPELTDPAERSSSRKVPKLLADLASGDETAVEDLFPLVYEELHGLANRYMKQEREDHTLQPTALIHEAYLRLVQPTEGQSSNFENIEHFMATAAVIMRRILINHAKSRNTLKRGAGQTSWQLDDVASDFASRSIDLVALDEALNELEQLDSIQHRLVELRFFGGLSFEQCAKILSISERKVYYEWSHAKAWLKHRLEVD